MFIVDLVGHVKICFPSMEHGVHKLKTLGWVVLLPLQKLSLLPSSTEIVIAQRKKSSGRTEELGTRNIRCLRSDNYLHDCYCTRAFFLLLLMQNTCDVVKPISPGRPILEGDFGKTEIRR